MYRFCTHFEIFPFAVESSSHVALIKGFKQIYWELPLDPRTTASTACAVMIATHKDQDTCVTVELSLGHGCWESLSVMLVVYLEVYGVLFLLLTWVLTHWEYEGCGLGTPDTTGWATQSKAPYPLDNPSELLKKASICCCCCC